MKRIMAFVLGALLVASSVPSFAGSGGKCTADTQTCLNGFGKYHEKGWLGVTFEPAEKGDQVVKAVTPGSPAEKAGFKAGDVMVTLNGAKVSDKEAMKKAKGEWKVGSQVTYTVLRDKAEVTLTAALAPMPEEVFAAMIGKHMIENHMSPSATVKAENPKN